jgi:hypothetical protein
MLSRSEVTEILRQELERATRQHEEAKRNFWRVSVDIPSGLPHPDGARRIQNAARLQTGTMAALAMTIRRFNAFLIDGTVPEDLTGGDPEHLHREND